MSRHPHLRDVANFFVFILVAVSYTHLDVYKRQASNRKLPQPDVSGLVRHPTMRPSDDSESLSTNALTPTAHGLARPGSISREDVDQSLHDIDIQAEGQKKTRGRGRRFSVKKLIKRLVILIILAALAFGGWIGVKTVRESNAVLDVYKRQHYHRQSTEPESFNVQCIDRGTVCAATGAGRVLCSRGARTATRNHEAHSQESQSNH